MGHANACPTPYYAHAEERRDPYNKLASVTTQAILEAKQEREDPRREKLMDREKKARERKAKEAANTASLPCHVISVQSE